MIYCSCSARIQRCSPTEEVVYCAGVEIVMVGIGAETSKTSENR